MKGLAMLLFLDEYKLRSKQCTKDSERNLGYVISLVSNHKFPVFSQPHSWANCIASDSYFLSWIGEVFPVIPASICVKCFFSQVNALLTFSP